MTLIALTSVKGAPGVTTASLGLAACWPDEDTTPVLVEADPAGGVLQACYGLPDEPGTVSLAAASRRVADADLLWRHAQWLPGGLAAVPGPVGPEQANATGMLLAGGAYAPLVTAAEGGAVVIADCGRAAPGSPATALMRAADVLVVLTRGDVASLARLDARLDALRDLNPRLRLVLIGRGHPYRWDEIAETLRTDMAGRLPHDPAGAALLIGAPLRRGLRTRWRAAESLPLMTASRRLAWHLRERPAEVMPYGGLTAADVPGDGPPPHATPPAQPPAWPADTGTASPGAPPGHPSGDHRRHGRPPNGAALDGHDRGSGPHDGADGTGRPR